MKIIDINKIVDCDIDLRNIVGIKQNWTAKCHSWNYLENSRTNSGLIYISKGKAVFTSRHGKTVTANKGDVVYLPAESNYFVSFNPSTSESMLINFEISYKFTPVAFSHDVFVAANDKNFLLREMFSELCESYIRITDKLLIKSKLFVLISELSRADSCSDSDNSINTAVFYINSHLNNRIGISELAKMCAMSESTFRRYFKSVIGCSPKEYINSMIIKKAKQMLTASDAPISEICSALGFYDNAYFTKAFKKTTGYTPAEYKKNQ